MGDGRGGRSDTTGHDWESLLEVLQWGGFREIGEQALTATDGLALVLHYLNRAERAVAVGFGRDSDIVELQLRAADRWHILTSGFSGAIKLIDDARSSSEGQGPQLSGVAGRQVNALGSMARDVLLAMDELSGEDVKRCLKTISVYVSSAILKGFGEFFVPKLRSVLEDGRQVARQLRDTQPMGTQPPVADTRSRAQQVCVDTAYALFAIAVVIDADRSPCSCCSWSVLAGLLPTILRASSASGLPADAPT